MSLRSATASRVTIAAYLLAAFAFGLNSDSAALGWQEDDSQESSSSQEKPQERRGVDLRRRPGGDLAPGSPGRRKRLQVPRGRVSTPTPASTVDGSGASSAAVGSDSPTGGPLASTALDAATAVFEELDRESKPKSSLLRGAEESLVAMGEEGLVAARVRLSSKTDAVLLTAARVLLRSEEGGDHELVLTRMRAKLPSAVAQPILRELVSRDPVRASPKLLVSLLDHPTGMMRAAAERELGSHLSPSLLPYLARALDARRADTRLRALSLANSIEDSGVLLFLADRLGDNSAKVCRRAADYLAARSSDEVEGLLRARAFEGQSALEAGRSGAYALLSLVQIENRSGRALVDDRDVPRLLEGLGTDHALISVTSAIALAGIGFRSPRSFDYTWLDLDVPHALIRWGSGVEFHADFSAVNELALRRVGLLSGESFGLDGLAWRRWWAEQAGRFRARRAVVPVSRLEASALAITLRSGYSAGEALAVLGPATLDDRATGMGRVVYVDVARCEALFDLLEREGVFGVTRMPASTNGYGDSRLLDVRIGDVGKLMEEPKGRDEAWFTRLVSGLESIEAGNRWQRWYDPVRYSTQREFWAAEKGSFAGDPDSLEHARAEIELMLMRLESFARTTLVDDREDEMLAALQEHYARPGLAQARDFSRFSNLLEREEFHGQRAAALLGLALEAGRVVESDEGLTIQELGSADRPLERSLAWDLLELLVQQQGPRVPQALARVVAAGGTEVARSAASSEHISLRAIAAEALASSQSEEDLESLGLLLTDSEPDVESAACRAIAAHDLQVFAPELLVRARLGLPQVRGVALQGLVTLKHPEAFEQLRIALFEPQIELQLAAARGIADLANPAAAPLLARLMKRGPGSPLFEPARRGLVKLGMAAADELLLLANSGSDGVRRESALILSYLGDPEALPLLLTTLTVHREDKQAAAELAVLSCVDFRNSDDPVAAWWAWWDLVIQDDSRAWIAASAEVARRPAPPLDALGGETNLEGSLFFLGLLSDQRPHVVERVRRELSRILGYELVLAEDEVLRADQRARIERELRSIRK